MRKIINHHIEGGMRESHPRVQDLKHPRLGKPRRGLQILDTWMGFPRPSLNVVLDSISSFRNVVIDHFSPTPFIFHKKPEFIVILVGQSTPS